MLVAIFILLLIVFFPLLSLLLGVGFMVVLVKFWWIFLILFGCLIFCRYIDKKEASEKEESKLKKQQEAIIGAIRGGQADQSNNHTKLIYKGEPELSNDSYVLYITKKYAIEKNEVLGKYVLNEKLYDSLSEVLEAGSKSELAEQEKHKKNLEEDRLRVQDLEKKHHEMMFARNANIKKMLMIVSAALVLIVIGRAIYLHFIPNGGDFMGFSEKSATEAANSHSCSAIALYDVKQTDGFGKNLSGCIRVKNAMGGDDGEMCPISLKKGDFFYPQSTYSDEDFCMPIRNNVERCYPKKAFSLYGACADSDLRQFRE